jgi:hypothetical protein
MRVTFVVKLGQKQPTGLNREVYFSFKFSREPKQWIIKDSTDATTIYFGELWI